jgi:hypothetical protein
MRWSSGTCCSPVSVIISASSVLAGLRLQEPFVQKRYPRLLSYDAVYSQILILLVVLNRRFRGRAKLAILYQDWKTSSLVEHELKNLYHPSGSLLVSRLMYGDLSGYAAQAYTRFELDRRWFLLQ